MLIVAVTFTNLRTLPIYIACCEVDGLKDLDSRVCNPATIIHDGFP